MNIIRKNHQPPITKYSINRGHSGPELPYAAILLDKNVGGQYGVDYVFSKR